MKTAVHHADRRLGAGADVVGGMTRRHRCLLFERIQLVVGSLLVDIAASRERAFAGTGKHDTADAVVGLERMHRVVHFPNQLPVHRVQNLRPVEGDDADAFLDLGQNAFVGHWFLRIFARRTIA